MKKKAKKKAVVVKRKISPLRSYKLDAWKARRDIEADRLNQK